MGDAARGAVDQLVARGHAALQAGDEASAMPLLEQALALDPRRPRPLQWLAAIRELKAPKALRWHIDVDPLEF